MHSASRVAATTTTNKKKVRKRKRFQPTQVGGNVPSRRRDFLFYFSTGLSLVNEMRPFFLSFLPHAVSPFGLLLAAGRTVLTRNEAGKFVFDVVISKKLKRKA